MRWLREITCVGEFLGGSVGGLLKGNGQEIEKAKATIVQREV